MKRRVETLAGVQTLSVERAALWRRDLAVVGRRPRSRGGMPCVLGVHAARIERDDEIGGDGAVDGEAICNLDGREVRRGRDLQSDRTSIRRSPEGMVTERSPPRNGRANSIRAMSASSPAADDRGIQRTVAARDGNSVSAGGVPARHRPASPVRCGQDRETRAVIPSMLRTRLQGGAQFNQTRR